MAEMEGVVAEGEQPKTENVEQKAIAGRSSSFTVQHAFHLQVPMYQLQNLLASPQDVS